MPEKQVTDWTVFGEMQTATTTFIAKNSPAFLHLWRHVLAFDPTWHWQRCDMLCTSGRSITSYVQIVGYNFLGMSTPPQQ